MDRTKRVSAFEGASRDSDVLETRDQQATEDLDVSYYKYDVFLSFRGPDTRKSFTDVLYDHMRRVGLRVFRDDDELAAGDMINKILPAIGDSEICVPIFSKTFASSKWCLREVARMVELNKLIIPIFYHVTPNDVKLKTPLYNNFMDQYVTENGDDTIVQKWKKALTVVAAIKGKEVLNESYTTFCKSFVEVVSSKLRPRRKFEFNPMIGLEDQVQHAIQLLDVQSTTGVRYLGIYGMGGIGKTTLAKAIVNKVAYKFDSYCLLENVQESVKREGIENLLKRLLSSVDPRSAMQPDLSRMMEECFHSNKILIVLDDVNKWEQIAKVAGKSKWFGPGSRIIVTTRDKSVMETGNGKLIEDEVRNMEMETLRQDQALCLFNWHAFKEGTIAAGFEELSKEAASMAAGLPLALEIIGSYLHNKKIDIWKEVVEKLKKIPQQDVQERLKISYDALQDEQKEIFVDIACFFVGFPRCYPIYMWEACKFYPHSGLDALCSMSLIKLTVDDEIWMHDLLRDLGREIVRQESPKNPTNRSRLWEDEDARKVLTSKKEKEIVEALRVDGDCSIDLLQRQIGSIENLRFLDLRLANLIGDFEGIFPNLKWLSYHCRENFRDTKFSVANLVILDFSASAINEDWIGWKQLKYAKNLKVLDLRRNVYLKRTPYFPEGMNLEWLFLDDCRKLEAVDSSIGNLRCLQRLNLKGCVSLTGLPEEIGHLKNLITVRISGHNQSFNLPESIGNLVELKYLVLQFLKLMVLPNSIGELRNLVGLDLQGSELINLPDSIGRLVNLRDLSLEGCNKLKNLPDTLGELKSLIILNVSCSGLVQLPDSLGDLQSLDKLDLTRTGIVEVPKSIGRLKNLKLLSLSNCPKIKVLPDVVGDLKSLVKLQLSSTGITELPESIGRLESLEEICLEHCQLKTLPQSLGALKKLEKLNAESADLSGGLPNELSGLSSLRYLTLSRSRIHELPSSINELNHLHTLALDNCHQLQELPDLPTNLISLSAEFTSLHRVHILSKLQHLTYVNLAIDRHSSDLDFGISMLSRLVTLLLRHRALTTLPNEFGNLDQLKVLYLFCPKLRNLPLLPPNLENLYLQFVYVTSLANLSDLKNLSILEVQCPSLVSLPDISHLKNLRNLSLIRCWSLVEIPGVGKLKSLHYLQIECCHSLTNLENLSELKEIQSVFIHCCRKICIVEGVDISKISIRAGNCQGTSGGSEHQVISDSQYDVISLLSSPGRDFLIGMDRCQVKIDSLKGKKVLLYFCRPFWETYTSLLKIMYSTFYSGGDLEVVNVSTCFSLDLLRSVDDFLDRMPWLSIPPSDLNKCVVLANLFAVYNMPTLVVFDERGELVTQRGFEIIGLYGSDAYPFTSERIKVLESITEDHKRNQSLTSIFSEKFLSSFDENHVPISKLEGKIVGIYFSSSSLEECDKFTHRLVEVYEELKSKGESFEIVGAPIEADFDAYLRIFETMPWQALRGGFSDCLKLYSYFGVSALPTLVIIGSDGKTLQPNAVNDVEEYGAKAYPFTPERMVQAREETISLMLSACRDSTIKNGGDRVHGSYLAGKNILLYFSTYRFPKPRAFLPKVIKAYHEIKARDDAFEVIFISGDEDEAIFHKNFSMMPWLALPYGHERIRSLAILLEVEEIPTLVAIGPTDRIITKDAGILIEAYGSDAYPFFDEHIMGNMVKGWPSKLQHALHPHELALTKRNQLYGCDGCHCVGHLWSYNCEDCDFDLHPKCAFAKGEHENEHREGVISLLVSACRDSAIKNGGDRVHVSDLAGKNILFFFSSHRIPYSRFYFLPELIDAYHKIKARDDAFEVIFMSNDKDEASFHEHFSMMPWLALPFGHEIIEKLHRLLEVKVIPMLVAIGPTEQIITKEAEILIQAYGSDAYPFTDEHILGNMAKGWPSNLQHARHQHELALTKRKQQYQCDGCNYLIHVWSYCCEDCDFYLHPKCAFTKGEHESEYQERAISLMVSDCRELAVKNGGDRIHVSNLAEKNILLYFSAYRIPHSRAFLPKLIEAYHEIKARDDAFEVMFISNDLDEASFHEHFSLMPWMALPFGHERIWSLAILLEIKVIPMLVAIGPTDQIITKEAEILIQAYGSDAYPFTDEHVMGNMAKGWPSKLRHALHPHELALTKRNQGHCCDGCHYEGHVWWFYCEVCNFNLHPKCAFVKGEHESEHREGAISLFVSACRDLTIKNGGDRVNLSDLAGKNILLFFSAHQIPYSRFYFLPKLIEAYLEIKDRDNAFEVIFVSNDEDEASFHKHISMMPWLALPYGHERIQSLYNLLEVKEIPELVAIGPSDQFFTKEAKILIDSYGSDAYPFTDEHVMGNMAKGWPSKLQHALHPHELTLTKRNQGHYCDGCDFLGHVWSYYCEDCNFNLHPKCAFVKGEHREGAISLLVSACRVSAIKKGGDRVHVSDLAGKNILLFFSAYWSSNSCAFLPNLIEAYHEIKVRDDAFEVILISNDVDEASFHKHFSMRQWLALPFGHERIQSLYSLLEVKQIPKLVVIGPTDQIITKEARILIDSYGSDAYPFTDEHVMGNMAKGWPSKLQHALHPHELALTKRNQRYGCDGCDNLGHVWSYYCEDCDFDLHPKCAFAQGKHETAGRK